MKEEGTSLPSPSHVVPLIAQRPPLSSTTRTFVNLVLCIVGSGVLSLPYTFSTIGWAMGFLTLTLSGAVAYHGMMLQIYSKRRLFRSRVEDLRIASYGDLVFHVFGPWGRLAVDVLLTLSTFACCISYITFISQSLASLPSSVGGKQLSSSFGFPVNETHLTHSTLFLSSRHPNTKFDYRNNTWVYDVNQSSLKSYRLNMRIVNDLVYHSLVGFSWSSSSIYAWLVFPLEVALAAIPSLTLLAPFSAVGDIVNFGALSAMMASDVQEIITTHGSRNIRAFKNMMAVPSAFGVGVYAFQSSGIMLPIEAAMAKPLKLGYVMGLAFVLSGLLYAVFAILGYVAFGENTEQVITLNLSNGIEAMVVKVAISFSLILAFPLVLNPMFELLERRFSRRKLSLGLRALAVFVICLMATTVKQFADFLSLAGSSISCLLGFILPAAVHIKVMKDDLESPPTPSLYAADYMLIVFGLIFGGFGTVTSFLKFF